MDTARQLRPLEPEFLFSLVAMQAHLPSDLLGSRRRQKIQRSGEHYVNHEGEHADEPRRATRRGYERRGERCE